MIKRHAQIKTHYMASDTDGSFQAISLPSGAMSEGVTILVHDGGATSYDPDTNCVGFQFSHDSDGSDGLLIVGPYGLMLFNGVIGGETIGYVKAAAGNKICITYDDEQ